MERNPKPGRRGNEEDAVPSLSTDVQWPHISSADQESLIELLCNTISPIGFHRTNHAIPSKGKKDKKRKRELETEPLLVPTPPLISSFVIVGLNNIVRRLESTSHKSNPESAMDDDAKISFSKENVHAHGNGYFAAIFVVSPSTPPVINSMLPQLVYTASLAHPQLPKARLIQLPKECEGRICQALSLPRVSCIGVLASAPQTKSFVDFVRRCVPEVHIAWLEEKLTNGGSSS